jgi:predicted ATPase
LALPDPHDVDPLKMAKAPAAALFLEHARRVQPGLVLRQAEMRPLAELLRWLDGIPLAIQIAAVHEPK